MISAFLDSTLAAWPGFANWGRHTPFILGAYAFGAFLLIALILFIALRLRYWEQRARMVAQKRAELAARLTNRAPETGANPQ